MNTVHTYLCLPIIIEMIINLNLYYRWIVLFIRLLVFIYVRVYLNHQLFIILLTRFVCRILLLLNRGKSFILAILGWDLLGLTSLLLVVYYDSVHVNTRAFNIMIVNSISDRIFVIIILLYRISRGITPVILILIITVVGIRKSSIWPLHYWLPLAIDAPTPVRCLLHRSTLVVAGYYLYSSVWRIGNNFLLLFLCYISYLISLNYMWCCEDIKKFIAYSTMINISIIIIYCRSIYMELSIIHVVSHRLYKRRLFLIAGYLLIYNSGNQDMRSISVPMRLILVIVLMISNLGGIFIFTISTEHLFKTLTIPVHLFVLPMILLRLFFILKITIKLLEVMSNSRKSSVLNLKLNNKYYSLIIPMLICLFIDLYIRKIQQMVYYERQLNNIVLLIIIFVIPIQTMHKREIDAVAPIRLDQDLDIETYINTLKRVGYIRLHAMLL